MKIVANVYSLDDPDEQHIIACFRKGQHVIGRGGALHIKDKRISRNHALIVVYDDRATITSTHSNPSLFKSAKDNRMRVLKENVENDLYDGDQFALTNEEFWFRVRLGQDVEETNGKRPVDSNDEDSDIKRQEDRETNGKRPVDSNDKDSDSKRLRLSNDGTTEENVTNNQNGEASTSNHQEAESIEFKIEPFDESVTNEEASTPNDQEEDSIEFKIEPLDEATSLNFNETQAMDDIQPVNEEPQNEADAAQTVKEEPPDEAAGGSGANAQPPRTKCWYGPNCYRKNPNHRVSFSHPGDKDYGSDSEDDKPECPYGLACYRKNLDHRREYKHVAQPAPKPRNMTVNVLQGCPYCDHCKGKHGGKPDYESDVDEP